MDCVCVCARALSVCIAFALKSLVIQPKWPKWLGIRIKFRFVCLDRFKSRLFTLLENSLQKPTYTMHPFIVLGIIRHINVLCASRYVCIRSCVLLYFVVVAFFCIRLRRPLAMYCFTSHEFCEPLECVCDRSHGLFMCLSFVGSFVVVISRETLERVSVWNTKIKTRNNKPSHIKTNNNVFLFLCL